MSRLFHPSFHRLRISWDMFVKFHFYLTVGFTDQGRHFLLSWEQCIRLVFSAQNWLAASGPELVLTLSTCVCWQPLPFTMHRWYSLHSRPLHWFQLHPLLSIPLPVPTPQNSPPFSQMTIHNTRVSPPLPPPPFHNPVGEVGGGWCACDVLLYLHHWLLNYAG
jgi:hypothetical protein